MEFVKIKSSGATLNCGVSGNYKLKVKIVSTFMEYGRKMYNL